jgi:hypothetical protein
MAMGRVRFEYAKQNESDIPEVRLDPGEVKDGTAVVTATFQIPHSEMKYQFEVIAIIAIAYGKVSTAGGDRDDYCAFIESLIQEVRDVIGAVVAVVK